jgi:hypothetical protein
LRANGSRERTPDDRLREAIHKPHREKAGLLRRFAPRKDDGKQIHTATNNATPSTISAIPKNSRPESDCLNE